MSKTVLATYANGVFLPKEPVDLPENSEVSLSLTPVVDVEQQKEAALERWKALVKHLQESTFNSGEHRPSREELYEGR